MPLSVKEKKKNKEWNNQLNHLFCTAFVVSCWHFISTMVSLIPEVRKWETSGVSPTGHSDRLFDPHPFRLTPPTHSQCTVHQCSYLRLLPCGLQCRACQQAFTIFMSILFEAQEPPFTTVGGRLTTVLQFKLVFLFSANKFWRRCARVCVCVCVCVCTSVCVCVCLHFACLC